MIITVVFIKMSNTVPRGQQIEEKKKTRRGILFFFKFHTQIQISQLKSRGLKGQLTVWAAHIPLTYHTWKSRLLNGHKLYPLDLYCYMHKHVILLVFLTVQGRAQFSRGRIAHEIKGCLQFGCKPFFTPPSTLHHRKPITTNANLIMETFPHLHVHLHVCMWVCHISILSMTWWFFFFFFY